MSAACIVLESLSLARRVGSGGDRSVLRSVQASFAAGEIAVVRGPTGAGKSTLLHLLAGLLRPTSGQVRYGDQIVSRFVGHHRERYRRRVGMAFQQPHLLADLSIMENVMLPLVPRAVSAGALRTAAAAALEQLSLGALAGHAASELSVGEQQRVGLARAVVSEPPILLADEPTAHQDAEAVGLVVRCLERAKRRGAVVVVASHDSRLLGGTAPDRSWELRRGILTELDR